MCSYNRAGYLPQAIDSVLAQTFHDFELIILDDASTDNTEEVVSSYASKDQRIRYIKHPSNLGLAKNRNAGLSEARGAYIAILDSDDLWNDPSKLSNQYSFLDQNLHCAVIGTFAEVIDDAGTVKGTYLFETTDAQIRKKMLLRDQIINSSALFRKDAAVEAGGYDNDLAPAEDYDLYLRIGKKHTFANLPECMTRYRIHSANTSSHGRKKKIEHAKLHLHIIKKYKDDYPNYFPALIKGYLRVIKSFLNL